jgi:hypothetical protein
MIHNAICFCACHRYPGVYFCEPCKVCGHYHSHGYMIGSVNEGWTRMACNVIDLTTSPADQIRYEIGRIYTIGIGTHRIEAVCVHSDGRGAFRFEEISDQPRPNDDQG